MPETPKDGWPHYHFYTLTDEGHIVRPPSGCRLPDDAAAVKHAKIIIEDNVIEIWAGTRVVAHLNPDDT